MSGLIAVDLALAHAKEELYNAIQAIESGDLPFARSSSLRAANLIVEAWQVERKFMPSPGEKDPTIVV